MDFNKVQFDKSYGTVSQLPPSDLPEIAFAGRSNVGKSSLLNALFNRKKLAKVSQTPGKTTTINFFSAPGANFVDLPGYGFAKVAKSEKERWSKLIEGYFNQQRNLSLVCSLIDIRHNATDLDVAMIDFLRQLQLPTIIVLTKGDKLSHSKNNAQKQALKRQLQLEDSVPMIITSATNKTGIADLQQVISRSMEF